MNFMDAKLKKTGSCNFGDQSTFDQCLVTRIKCQKSWLLLGLRLETW